MGQWGSAGARGARAGGARFPRRRWWWRGVAQCGGAVASVLTGRLATAPLPVALVGHWVRRADLLAVVNATASRRDFVSVLTDSRLTAAARSADGSVRIG